MDKYKKPPRDGRKEENMLQIILILLISSLTSALVSLAVAREAAKHYIVEIDKYEKSTMDGLEEAADVLFAAQKRVLEQFDDIRKSNIVIYRE